MKQKMITTAHCFFEQTGTFKSVFKGIGISAYDYDIEDNFGETDFKIDLFGEIQNAYDNKGSIFDNFTDNDLIFAFFPCTRFCANNKMLFLCNADKQRKWSDDKKIEYSMNLESQRSSFFIIFSKFYLVCLDRKIKTIIENPFTQPHYLTEYFPIKPAFIDKDRSIHMDKFKKPTQYFFINFKPKDNHLMFKGAKKSRMKIHEVHGFKKSMIEKDYAEYFVNNYLIKDFNKNFIQENLLF